LYIRCEFIQFYKVSLKEYFHEYTMQTSIITHDTLFNGEIVCLQNRQGYRFSVDAVILAHFIHPTKGDIILDLGTGCGVISLILAYRWKNILQSIVGLEIQESLASLARRNIAINELEELCQIVRGDVKTLSQYVNRESFSKVVCNPPFYKAGTGRTNKNREALLARHQITATLADFISYTTAAVKNKGAAYFIYPAQGISEFLFLAKQHQLEPKKLMFVYSYPQPEKSADLVLIKCLKNGGSGVEIMAPFYIYEEKNGEYSADMAKYYR